LQTCRWTEALLAAIRAQVLEIQIGILPHAEETKVSPSGPPVVSPSGPPVVSPSGPPVVFPSGPPVPSNNDGSPPKKGHSSNCSKHVG